MRLTVASRRLRLRRPLRAAWGELRERELLEVRLATSDGLVGRGEAAPLEPYDGVPLAAVRAALDVYANVLAEAPEHVGHGELIAACLLERRLPQALAAVDLALWDLAAQRAGRPVAALLHESALESVPVNATVWAVSAQEAAEAAADAAAEGFRCVKLKVGAGGDSDRLAALRAAIEPRIRVRIDANGAWESPGDALEQLHSLAGFDLELCEEPVHGTAALRAVREASPVPVAMDETADDLDAVGSGAADFVCLKLARCGGITGLLRTAAIARAGGSRVYVASTLDGPLGIAAALHAAAALGAEEPLPACGLATLREFEDVEDPFELRDGALVVPPGPGLDGIAAVG